MYSPSPVHIVCALCRLRRYPPEPPAEPRVVRPCSSSDSPFREDRGHPSERGTPPDQWVFVMTRKLPSPLVTIEYPAYPIYPFSRSCGQLWANFRTSFNQRVSQNSNLGDTSITTISDCLKVSSRCRGLLKPRMNVQETPTQKMQRGFLIRLKRE